MRADSLHQILPDCNPKANGYLAIHRPEITKMAPISTIPKGKRTSNFESFASRKRRAVLRKHFDPRAFDSHSLYATHIHSAFGDGKPHAILLYVFRREPCGEAYLLRFCREQSLNSAGAWSNW
jgi:hypothetical protein